MSVENGVMTPKKKSLLGSLGKSIGSVFYDQDTPTDENEATDTAPAASPVTSTAAPSTYVPLSPVGGVDQATRDRLQQAMQENGLNNTYDYLKFKSSLNDLSRDIPDERLRYKTVFSTAKAMGVTREKLAQTATHYLTVLDEEAKKFNEAVNDQTQESIVQGEQHVKQIDDTISAKTKTISDLQAQVAAQVKQLNDEINSLNSERIKLTGEIANNKNTIESSKARFTATHTTMVQEIKDDINKMSNYLG